MGNVQRLMGKFDDSLASLRKALDIYSEEDDEQGAGRTRNNLGILLESLGRHEEALAMHEKSLAIKTRVCDYDGAAKARNNLGNSLAHLGQHDRALENYRSCLEYWFVPPSLASSSCQALKRVA
jgi:tetratricopeptide (TPR) repeat protein